MRPLHTLSKALAWLPTSALLLALAPNIAAKSTGGVGFGWVGENPMPECALHCIREGRARRECNDDDHDCLCIEIPSDPVAGSCVMQRCSVADAMLAANTSATECGAPIRDRSNGYYVTALVLGPITLLCIALRLLGRPTVRLQWHEKLDDIIMVFVGFMITAMTVCSILLVHNGYGKDIHSLYPYQVTTIMKYILASQVLFNMIVMLVKLSILVFYLRVFPFVVFPGVRIAIWCLIAVVVGMGAASLPVFLLQCSPMPFMWNWVYVTPDSWQDGTGGKCMDVHAIGLANMSVYIATNVAIMAVPLPELLKLRLPWWKKIQVLGIFMMGGLVTVVTIPLLIAMTTWTSSLNPTYDWVPVSKWSSIEAYIGVILSCLPRISIFITRIYWRGKKTTSGTGTTSGDRSTRSGSRAYVLSGPRDSAVGFGSADGSRAQSSSNPKPPPLPEFITGADNSIMPAPAAPAGPDDLLSLGALDEKPKQPPSASGSISASWASVFRPRSRNGSMALRHTQSTIGADPEMQQASESRPRGPVRRATFDGPDASEHEARTLARDMLLRGA